MTPYRDARGGGHARRRDRLHYAGHQGRLSRPSGRRASGSARASWRCTTCSARCAARVRISRFCWRMPARMRCDGLRRRRSIRLAEQLGGSGVDLDRRRGTRTGRWTPASPGCRWWPRTGGGSLAVVDLVRTSAGGRAFRVRLESVGQGGAASRGLPLARRAREARAPDRQSGAARGRADQAAAHAAGAAACAWAR